MLEELALQYDIIDERMELSRYRLLILPEDFRVSKGFEEKLKGFTEKGGSVIVLATGGLKEDGEYPRFFGVSHLGKAENIRIS